MYNALDKKDINNPSSSLTFSLALIRKKFRSSATANTRYPPRDKVDIKDGRSAVNIAWYAAFSFIFSSFISLLSESIILTLIAGILGLMLGVGLLSLVGMALSGGDQFFQDPQISFTVAISALFILLIIGTLAGFIPANRAMKIKPIEAIREE